MDKVFCDCGDRSGVERVEIIPTYLVHGKKWMEAFGAEQSLVPRGRVCGACMLRQA